MTDVKLDKLIAKMKNEATFIPSGMYLDEIQAIITALERLLPVDAGRCLIVPVEPSYGTAFAMAKVWDNEPDEHQIECAMDTYRAMITEHNK